MEKHEKWHGCLGLIWPTKIGAFIIKETGVHLRVLNHFNVTGLADVLLINGGEGIGWRKSDYHNCAII
jgi:hypothetical protein